MLTKSELKEWTDWMLANPDKRAAMVLHDSYGYCCLGVLAMLNNIPMGTSPSGKGYYQFPCRQTGTTCDDNIYLAGDLSKKLGSSRGSFREMGMPNLFVEPENHEYGSLSDANDQGVPWEVIVEHLLNHYPAIDDPD